MVRPKAIFIKKPNKKEKSRRFFYRRLSLNSPVIPIKKEKNLIMVSEKRIRRTEEN
jgi:hypothetical protein